MCEETEIDKIIKNLQNPERIYRQNALKQLQEIIHNFEQNDENLIKYFDLIYLYLLKCYADKYEICRSLSCLVINEFIAKLPDNDFYLHTIVPVICRRIGQTEIIEDSEEMRLDLCDQLLLLIEKYKANNKKDDKLMKSYNDIIDILLKTLRDPYPAVQKKSCSIILVLSKEKCFHYRAEALINPLIQMLQHRHSANRIAAIEAMGHASVKIYTSGDCIMKIITEISPLLMDSMANVRKECGRTGCLMLMNLRDRYSYFEKILPLVLCCLCDENEEVRSDIESRWIECGELYYNENETELSKVKIVDTVPDNYMPEVKRPTLGCRALIQRSLRVINVILHEMEDWKDEVRLFSLKLLGQVVLYAEKALTAKFMEIYPVLAKCCMDSNAPIANEAFNVAKMLGILLDYKAWSCHAYDGLKTNTSLGYIRCFTGLYIGSGKEKINDLYKIVAFIKESRICYSTKPKVQSQMMLLFEKLINDFSLYKENISEKTDDLEKIFYQNIINIAAISFMNSMENKDAGELLLLKLNENLNYLSCKYLEEMINSIEGIDSKNSDESEPILLLNGYIQICGFRKPYMQSLQNAIKAVLENAQPEAKLQILTAVSIAMLTFNFEKDLPLDESTEIIEKFIEEIISPCLIWHAGRSSESIRSMGIACLCSISENAVEESYKIFPKIIKQLISLIDDNNVRTRNFSLRCLLKCGPIDQEFIKELGIAIASRLDDPSADVRELSARCIGKIKVDVENPCENENWKMLLQHILRISVHHIEDPDIRLKNAIADSLKLLATENKDIFLKLINEPTFVKYKELDFLRNDEELQ